MISINSEDFINRLLSGEVFTDNLKVVDIDLKSCTSLKTLPDNLKVKYNLYLTRCTSLKTLPDNLKVGWNLYLQGCTSLKSLPDNLKVGGYLNLEGCTSLKSIPNNLEVGWNLYLKGCTSLISLPEDLEVGGIIYCDRDLIDCILLIDLPMYFNFHFEDSIKSYLLKKLKNSSIYG